MAKKNPMGAMLQDQDRRVDMDPVKKKADKSREITSKDMLPQVIVNGGNAETKSSVEIKQTAKGDPVVEVKIYLGTTQEEANTLARIAYRAYKKTRNLLDGDAE